MSRKAILLILVVIALLFVFLSNQSPEVMQITSPAFEEGGLIPSKYTCDGDNVSPSLEFTNVPKNAVSLALIMDDPDIPDFVKEDRGIEVFDHWVVFNIPASAEAIEEAATPQGTVGLNSRGSNEYVGSCPPDREHRYFFKLYALDTELNLEANTSAEKLRQAMQGHIIEEAQLMGRYERKDE